MKHLYSLVFALIALTSSNLSSAQFVYTIPASSPSACDGSAHFYDNANYDPAYWTWTWYEDSTTVIASGDSVVSNLCTGSYSLVLDSAGTVIVVPVTVTNPCSNFSLSMYNTQTTPGNCSGYVSASPSGGTYPYSFSWSNGSVTTSYQYGLCAGAYNVTCVDAIGCSLNGSAVVMDSVPPINPGLVVVDASAGACNGSASVSPTNGSGTYTYLWNTGETTSTINMLCPGSYLVSIFDGTDTVTVTFTVQDLCAGFIGTYSSTPVSGPGICDATITFTPIGGTPPYVYSWNTGATTQSLSNLCSGNYTATATDVNGCMTSPIVVMTANPISVNLTTTGDLTGNCIGEASAVPTGGAGSYSYLWSTGETTSAIGNLCVGNYSVTIWDSVDTVTLNFTITNPCTGFTGSFTSTGTINGNCTGTSIFTASGGLAPYEYSWDNGVTFSPDSTASNLCAGIWDFICIDANGCSFNQQTTISDSTVTTVNISVNLTTADDSTNNCSGNAFVSVSGGIPPYSVYWTTGETTPYIDSLCPGIYTVYVIDATNIDTVVVDFVITDSSSTYSNNPYPNATTSGALYSDLIANCIIDYNTIDSASLYQAVYDSINQNLYVTWAVYSPTDTVYINDTLGWAGNPGYYSITISVYCPNKSGDDFFKIESVIYFDGSTVYFSTLGIGENPLDDVSIYPNPFSNSISVDNKNGAIRSMKLIDLNGRIISELGQVSVGVVELNELESISSGTYLLILSGEGASKTYKVIK